MSTPSRYTMLNALAQMAVTGRNRCANIWTKIEVNRFTVTCTEIGLEYGFDKDTTRYDFVTTEGSELVFQSRMYKGYRYLRERGFRFDSYRRHQTTGHISMEHPDGRRGFVSDGYVYAAPDAEVPYKTELVARFTNGARMEPVATDKQSAWNQ